MYLFSWLSDYLFIHFPVCLSVCLSGGRSLRLFLVTDLPCIWFVWFSSLSVSFIYIKAFFQFGDWTAANLYHLIRGLIPHSVMVVCWTYIEMSTHLQSVHRKLQRSCVIYTPSAPWCFIESRREKEVFIKPTILHSWNGQQPVFPLLSFPLSSTPPLPEHGGRRSCEI